MLIIFALMNTMSYFCEANKYQLNNIIKSL